MKHFELLQTIVVYKAFWRTKKAVGWRRPRFDARLNVFCKAALFTQSAFWKICRLCRIVSCETIS
jgi:hypothetical protein